MHLFMKVFLYILKYSCKILVSTDLLSLGNSLASLDSMMPATKEGLCQNIPTARYLLQYGCITYDISVYQTDEDKCKYVKFPVTANFGYLK